MVARQVVPKLNQLEELVSEAARRRAAADPSDPEQTPYVYTMPTAPGALSS